MFIANRSFVAVSNQFSFSLTFNLFFFPKFIASVVLSKAKKFHEEFLQLDLREILNLPHVNFG